METGNTLSMTQYASLRDQFVTHISWDGKCWVWTGYCNKDGHGRLMVGGRKGRLVMATHVAFFLKWGRWPTLQLNHTCDKPECITIKHLYEGTQKQNIQDMLSRGRQVSPTQKFFRVDGIDYTMDELARRAGVSRLTIIHRLQKGLTDRELIAPRYRARRRVRNTGVI